jgi:hypothetical protein
LFDTQYQGKNKKRKKMLKYHWTKLLAASIVAILYFLPCQADNAAAELQGNVKKAESLCKRCAGLEAKLARRDKDLERLREDFAETLISLKKLRDEHDALKLQAKAVALADVSDTDADVTRQLLAERGQTTLHLKKMLEDVGRLRPFFKVMMQAKSKSISDVEVAVDGRIILLEERLKALVNALDPMSKDKTVAGGFRVLEVTPKFVILNGGRNAGIRIGSKWKVRTATSEVILQIVEIRHTVSASVVVKGNSDELVAGAEAKSMVMRKAEN